MRGFKPDLPYNVPMYLLKPVKPAKKVNGVLVPEYAAPTEEDLIYCSFRSFGGTESTSNGVLIVEKTANVETWYNPEIKSDCRLCMAENLEEIYEILGAPENVAMRCEYHKFKARLIAGGA